MSIKALQEYTYISKYARFNVNEKRRETYYEATDRVRNMHLSRFPQVEEEITDAFEIAKMKRVLGSQRALQFGGTPILKKNARIYNCIAAYCDRPRFFQECFWLLLCGCGTGFSVQKHHIAKLPDFYAERSNKKKEFLVPDTIEGWADAFGILIASYMPHPEFQSWAGHDVEFNFSEIRPAGSVLASGVGKAPGPEPLRRSLSVIKGLLDNLINVGLQRLRPIDAYDIIMHVSDAVLSGGVRRSATLCMFSHDDEEMVNAKTGNWFTENPQRARSNNSAVLLRNKVTKEEFFALVEKNKQFGEPGFIWVSDLEALYNPCVEISLYAYDEEGNSGWQACVAGETQLLTKQGIVQIKDAVDKEIEIWNGQSWKKVVPFITGRDRKLYRVTLSDGSHLDCTSNHKWLVKNRFQSKYTEVETKDLLSFSKYAISTPKPNIQWDGEISQPNAYELGFTLGDGYASRTDTDSASDPSAAAFNPVTDTAPFRCVSHELKYCDGLPSEIFQWDRKSCLKFIAGWLDADGSKAGRGFRIYGRKDKIYYLQLLLTKLGFYSSFNLMSKAGSKTNIAVRKQDVWYVQVSDPKDICSRRIKFESKRKHSGKGITQVIKSVVQLDGLHDTFCVHEPELNQCVFNNVLTKQCNLCEINGKKIKTKEDFAIAAKAAAIIGTLQASYTDMPYLGPVSKKIIEKEALLGVSITGMMDNPDVIFNPEIQKEMATLIVKTNKEFAKKIGINPAARCTCVKPAGTTSCILGSASGIHPHHATRYFRRIQGNWMEPPLQYFKKFNPQAVEKSVWSANGTDEVISFCVEVPSGAKTKNQLSAVTLLEHVLLTQNNWVAAGKNAELCVKPWLTHNVSNTINIRPEEWDDVAEFIYEHRDNFAGIALLPQSGDLDYPQAPMCTVYNHHEIVSMYGEGCLFASGLIVDGLRAFNDNLWAACDVVLGFGAPLLEPVKPDEEKGYPAYVDSLQVFRSKIDWVRRAKQFAERYFESDYRKMTYCLKCVHNWKLWQDLTRDYVDVDFSKMFESEDNTKVSQEWACSGGKCELR